MKENKCNVLIVFIFVLNNTCCGGMQVGLGADLVVRVVKKIDSKDSRLRCNGWVGNVVTKKHNICISKLYQMNNLNVELLIKPT